MALKSIESCQHKPKKIDEDLGKHKVTVQNLLIENIHTYDSF